MKGTWVRMESKRSLKIYFTSDVHGYIFPTSYDTKEHKPMGLLHCIHNFKKDENTLIIDGGDSLQGSPLAYYCQKYDRAAYPMAEVMNAAGYDFITLGNHDFNYGYEYLKGYLEKLDAVCLSENVKDELGELPITTSFVKVMGNGLKVGLVGIVTDYVNLWERPENIKNLKVTDPFPKIKEAYEKMKEEADICICIYHGGFEEDLDTGKKLSNTTENIGNRICRELGFDVLLTGHQHMGVKGMWQDNTYIVQTPANAMKYIELNISETKDGLKITSDLKEAGNTCDKNLYESLLPVEERVQRWLDEPVGFLPHSLLPKEPLHMAVHGTEIADFFNQVQFESSGAQISCTSLANEVAGFNSEVTVRDVIATYRFPNILVVLKVSGAVLKQALERVAEYFEIDSKNELCISDSFLKPKVEHYNYDFFSGICYNINVKKPKGDRVESITYEGNPVKMYEYYTLCMNNYRSSGAGGYEMYQGLEVVKEIQIEMPELILQYFEKYPKVRLKKNGEYHVKW